LTTLAVLGNVHQDWHTFSLRSASLIGLFVRDGGVAGLLEEFESAMTLATVSIMDRGGYTVGEGVRFRFTNGWHSLLLAEKKARELARMRSEARTTTNQKVPTSVRVQHEATPSLQLAHGDSLEPWEASIKTRRILGATRSHLSV
jgi:hypothetical protein